MSLAADPTFQARFRAEAALAAKLHEPHVIPIHDFGEIDGQLYIDMRLVEGPDLAHLLPESGPLPAQRVVDIVTQVATALDAAHTAGLVHRDIKPGNVLIVRSEGDVPTDFVYVADFGIARALDGSTSGSLTSTGTTVGSLDYIAPERFGNDHGDRRADIYALGCVLYEALTAEKPVPRARPARHRQRPPQHPTARTHRPTPRPARQVWTLSSPAPWPRTPTTATRRRVRWPPTPDVRSTASPSRPQRRDGRPDRRRHTGHRRRSGRGRRRASSAVATFRHRSHPDRWRTRHGGPGFRTARTPDA